MSALPEMLGDDFDVDDELGYPIPPTVTNGDFDDPMPPDSPTPAGAEDVDRMLRRVAAIRRKVASVDRIEQTEIDRIRGWAARRKGILERQERWLAVSIEGWIRQHHEETGAKTVTLPHGTVKARPARMVVDASQVTDSKQFAETYPEFARVRHEVALQTISRICEPGDKVDGDEAWADPIEPNDVFRVVDPSTGEVIPGVFFRRPVAPRYSYEVGK